MALLSNLFSGRHKGDPAVRNALARLDREKAPIRLEVEGANLRFYTRLSLRNDMVVVVKPPGLRQGVDKGTRVRFQVPGGSGLELRMEVTAPHFNLSSGAAVFLCRIPDGFVEGPRRKAARFDTTRFSNIRLTLPVHPQPFRVVNVSEGGVKIHLGSQEAARLLHVDKPIPGGTLQLGERMRVDLASVVPRNRSGITLGCEMRVAPEGPSMKVLHHLLASLERAEAEQLRG